MQGARPPITDLYEDTTLASLQHVNDVPVSLCCPICVGVLQDAIQCHEGHCMCQKCAEKCLAITPECPECRCGMNPAKLSRPPALLREALAGLLVHCPHADTPEKKQLETKKPKVDGERASCGWSGRHEFVERHLRDDCSLTICKCKLCERKMTVLEIEAHTNEDCPRRLIPCAYCANDFMAENVKSHEDDCDASPHAILVCICGEKMERQALDNHMETTSGHLQLLASRNRSLEAVIAAMKISAMTAELAALKKQFSQFQDTIELELHKTLSQIVKIPFDPEDLASHIRHPDAFIIGGVSIKLWMYTCGSKIPRFQLNSSVENGPVSTVTVTCTVEAVEIATKLTIASNKQCYDTTKWVRLPMLPIVDDGHVVVNVTFTVHSWSSE